VAARAVHNAWNWDGGVILGVAGHLFGEQAPQGLLKPVADMSDLEEFGQAGHQHAGADEQGQTQRHPYKGVDLTVDVGEPVNKSHVITNLSLGI